jgi:hypothetical protein
VGQQQIGYHLPERTLILKNKILKLITCVKQRNNEDFIYGSIGVLSYVKNMG